MAYYTCAVCAREFHRAGKRKALCCSLKCKYQYTSITRKGVPLKSRRGVYKNCEVCGKEKYIHPGKVSATGRLYCSAKCRNSDPSFWDAIRGENNHAWKGGKYLLSGYVYVKSPNHPNKNSSGYVAEHRLVMEKELGRYLTPNEEVHHKNQDKKDNKIENLEVVIKSAHYGIVVCPKCEEKIKLK